MIELSTWSSRSCARCRGALRLASGRRRGGARPRWPDQPGKTMTRFGKRCNLKNMAATSIWIGRQAGAPDRPWQTGRAPAARRRNAASPSCARGCARPFHEKEFRLLSRPPLARPADVDVGLPRRFRRDGGGAYTGGVKQHMVETYACCRPPCLSGTQHCSMGIGFLDSFPLRRREPV